jgi:signal transduction histidine kinase
LVGSLKAFVEAWSKHHKCDGQFQAINIGDERLDPEIEMNLYRIAQEALNNVAKHAGAKSVNVIIEGRERELRLIIEDDGKGFDPADVKVPDSPGGGLGISGMRERVDLIGGTLDIESSVEGGTTIYVRSPRKPAHHHAYKNGSATS